MIAGSLQCVTITIRFVISLISNLLSGSTLNDANLNWAVVSISFWGLMDIYIIKWGLELVGSTTICPILLVQNMRLCSTIELKEIEKNISSINMTSALIQTVREFLYLEKKNT